MELELHFDQIDLSYQSAPRRMPPGNPVGGVKMPAWPPDYTWAADNRV
jgi:hypothetical protein